MSYCKSARVRLYNKDALELLKSLNDGSIDLICTDPPYYRVKEAAWDRQWKTRDDYLAWIERLCVEWCRVLAPNGSFYLFASPQMTWWVEEIVRRHFVLLSNIRWDKPSGMHRRQCKEALRKPFPNHETILFAEQRGGERIRCEQLAEYFRSERERSGMTGREIGEYFAKNGFGRHKFARHTFTPSQWTLPSQREYELARQMFTERTGRPSLTRPYEEIRDEYKGCSEKARGARRPYHVTKEVPYTDTWNFEPVQHYPGKHICEKPRALIEHILRSSGSPGCTVLDSFAGSGVVLRVAAALGYQAIGSEIDPDWCLSM